MRQTKHRSGVVAGVLLPLGLICVFAFCSLALALMGGDAYRKTNDAIDESYNSTMIASYLRTKLTQNNRAGAIEIRTEHGIDYLVINTENGFETRIYVYDNMLRESMISQGEQMDAVPPYSVQIAQVESCTFSISDDGLFEAEIVTPGGDVTRLAVALAQEVDA